MSNRDPYSDFMEEEEDGKSYYAGSPKHMKRMLFCGLPVLIYCLRRVGAADGC
ncbi:MAG: hypothetical protein ABSF15_20350 [Candidatus Sulfotelmatobacter sp.]